MYGVNRSTIHRDMSALERRGTGLIKVGRCWQIDHRRALYSAKFTPYELVALYMAARLLSRHSDEQNPHVIKALEKLADALRGHSSLVSQRLFDTAEAVRERPARPEYVEAFETITQEWLQGRMVHLIYQRYADSKRTERRFATVS